MVKDGYELLFTRPDLENRRCLAVYLTPKGKDLINELKKILEVI